MELKDAEIKALRTLCKLYRKKLSRFERPMDEQRVIQILRSPSASLVNALLEEANLTAPELEAINHCVRLDYTQLEAADVLECSRNYVQKNYSSGMKKLKAAWANIPFLN